MMRPEFSERVLLYSENRGGSAVKTIFVKAIFKKFFTNRNRYDIIKFGKICDSKFRGVSMRCLYCNCTESKVIDSRSADDDKTIRRRRECTGCGRRFTTYETIEIAPILVVKSDGNRQAYDIGKIKRGIIKACEK